MWFSRRWKFRLWSSRLCHHVVTYIYIFTAALEYSDHKRCCHGDIVDTLIALRHVTCSQFIRCHKGLHIVICCTANPTRFLIVTLH
jgi:hypothetical protein